MKIALLSLFMIYGLLTYSQECEYFPADCPLTGNIEAVTDSETCLTNLIVPEEITMQNHLRQQITNMLAEIASKEKWTLYEYTEEAGGLGSNGVPTPLRLRRPHEFSISFVIVTNEDSLRAWQNWYQHDLKDASDAVVQSFQGAGNDLSNDASLPQYADSATFYANLKTKYMTEHASDYQKAISSGNTKDQKKYETAMSGFDEKINAFVEKTNGHTVASLSAAEKKNENLQSYRLRKTIAFRNASILRVRLDFNDPAVAVYQFEEEKNARIAKTSRPMSLPGASLVVSEHNAEPDNEWDQGTDISLVLVGKWDTRADESVLFHAGFSKDKKNMGKETVKKIRSDKVQSLAIYVEGAPGNTQTFLQLIDLGQLKKEIVVE